MNNNKDFNDYPIQRDLDGIFIRTECDGKWCNRCFTDLTSYEQQDFLDSLDMKGLRRMCLIMAETLRKVGDQLDILSREPEDSDDE